MSVCFSGRGWVLCVGSPQKVKKKFSFCGWVLCIIGLYPTSTTKTKTNTCRGKYWSQLLNLKNLKKWVNIQISWMLKKNVLNKKKTCIFIFKYFTIKYFTKLFSH
jgi:hypothetical protein